MSPARHHAEWMSLIETSGPFLTMPVLLRVFPQGLEQRDAAKAARLRETYEDWLDRGKQPAVHHAWIRHVLTELLDYPSEFLAEGQAIPPGLEAVMPNYAETLRPDFVLKHRESNKKPLLLIEVYAPDQDLDKPVVGKVWKASPGTRMMELLHVAEVPLGLITNGEQWMIVYAPRGETTGFASWYADLWMQEPITLRAFHSLLDLRRFLGVAEPETLAALFAESAKDQHEVTEQLGYQVRCAVEMLVQAFDRIDVESGRAVFANVDERALYNSALTVMMRLVFLFCAEERKLLLLGDPLYDQYYAVSTLSELLRERADQHGEEVLERRHDAWCRLLAAFRAVHAGLEHDAMRLPPYGGTLFDPDRFPFLEGRAADTQWQTTHAKPLPINNRVVLHLLEALQVLRVKVPGAGNRAGAGQYEARRVSFRALDIEQIGHVYEGLLDHTAKRAQETILGLIGTRDNEPEISLSRLEELAGMSAEAPEPSKQSETTFLLAAETLGNVIQLPVDSTPVSYAPPENLIEFLVEETGRSPKSISKALTDQSRVDENRLFIACGHDRRLLDRVWKFASLVRLDTFGFPVVICEGSAFVTTGRDRRSTGTHYTPRSLTEPIVEHTLEPLVYSGPAEGLPREQWQLKSPKEILALKVCDLAMGSGAFLVQTCRYLAERLVEAWENAEQANPGQFIATPEGKLSSGDPSERLLPADPAERLAIARRYVADRCLYGVDINPMAVEMAKLSLWLITLQRDRPFTFLDHALKCGDSLLGVSSVKQIENFSLRPGERQVTFATANLFRYVDEASAKRRALEELPSNDQIQIETKNRLHAEAEAATAKVKALADCLIAFELRGVAGNAYEDQRTDEAEKLQLLMQRDADASIKSPTPNIKQLSAHAREQLHGRRTFHWALEFPEVFDQAGFSAFVGNPPFMGGKKVTAALSVSYRNLVVQAVAQGVIGAADLCAYFFLRAAHLLAKRGTFGLLATNSICEGDTRIVGLTHLVAIKVTIFRAVASQPWPGQAGVNVALVWLINGAWKGNFDLGGSEVPGISDYLTSTEIVTGAAFSLMANNGLAFAGTYINGEGFILTLDEASELISEEGQNQEVIFPYLTGRDVTSEPDQRATRYVINFHTWSRTKAEQYKHCFSILTDRVKPYRDTLTKQVHESDYWKFWDKRLESYKAISQFKRVLIAPRVSKLIILAWVPANQVFSDQIVVFTNADLALLSIFQSSIHQEWAWNYCSTIREAGIRYAPSKAIDTFPLPPVTNVLRELSTTYESRRQQYLNEHKCGLTDVYNKLNEEANKEEAIRHLRCLHMDIDRAVAAAYGWSDLDLGHGFHVTKQGERYTLSEPARRAVLDRLLALNHQRYAEEVKAGLNEKGVKNGKAIRPKAGVSADDVQSASRKPTDSSQGEMKF